MGLPMSLLFARERSAADRVESCLRSSAWDLTSSASREERQREKEGMWGVLNGGPRKIGEDGDGKVG